MKRSDVVKSMCSCLWSSISELRDVTCHMGSHIVTCHLTQVNRPCHNPSQTDRYLIYLPQRDGRLSWPGWLVTSRDCLATHRQSSVKVLTRSQTCNLLITSRCRNHYTTQATCWLLRHCTIRARRASTGSVRMAIALQELDPTVWRRSCPDSGNQAGTAEDRDIFDMWCQLPLRHLRTFLCVEDRAICASSYLSANLSLLWFEIRRVDSSVHHVESSLSHLFGLCMGIFHVEQLILTILYNPVVPTSHVCITIDGVAGMEKMGHHYRSSWNSKLFKILRIGLRVFLKGGEWV